MTSDRQGLDRSRRAWVLVLLALVVTTLPLGAPPSRAADDEAAITAEPKAIIEDAAQKIVAILKRKDEPAEVRVSEIEAIAYEIFDFTTMSKLVLARNWRKLDKPIPHRPPPVP